MAEVLLCPECSNPIAPKAIKCKNCGTALQLVAVLADGSFVYQEDRYSDMQISPELLVPRLGDLLMEQDLLKKAALEQAIDYQKNQEKNGHRVLIGQALLEMGLITRAELDKVVTEQILQLQAALQQMNQTLEKRVQQRTMELEKALAQLSELNELKSNFIANVSHELRTPITHLRGYLELLKEETLGPLTEEQGNALRTMDRAENRLEELIESLIQFAHFERHDMALHFQEIDLRQLFGRAISLARQKCLLKKLDCCVELPDLLPAVKGDEERLYWVFYHLIDNAVKFTPEGGKITLGAYPRGPNIVIYISDTGIGISSDRLEEVFEPFHQLDGSSTRRFGGTGLGLSLVKKIADAHGSSIEIQSDEGQGTCVSFSLSAINLPEKSSLDV